MCNFVPQTLFGEFSPSTKAEAISTHPHRFLPERVMQVRRTTCKKAEAEARFQKLLRLYAEKHKRGKQSPRLYRESDVDSNGNDQPYPNEQPHPSTNDYDTDCNDEIDPIGPVDLLIESIVWYGMKVDDELRFW